MKEITKRRKQLRQALETHDLKAFEKEWETYKDKLSDAEKQNWLKDIVDIYYSDKHFSFFKKVFDRIIGAKLSLDFNIDEWAHSLLALAVDKASRRLFDYFLKKGANLNFVADVYFYESKQTIKREVKEWKQERYLTCLDFAIRKLNDSLSIYYDYSVPEVEEYYTSWMDIDDDETITIQKSKYYYLIEQAQYLQDLIYTDRLVDYIQSIGGKTYEQLQSEKKSLIALKFGIPHYGWLPVTFDYGDFHLEFDASNAWNNPVTELAQLVKNGLIEGQIFRVMFWLEMPAYFFDFEQKGEQIILNILETNNPFERPLINQKCLKITGTEKEILQPIRQALKAFSKLKYWKKHWK